MRLATVDQALHEAQAMGLERLDAQWLLAHVLAQPRTWLLAHGDAPLTDAHEQALLDLYRRRAAGEPYAYLVGEQEFHGLVLQVDRHVLVPRPDTEVLVDWAIELLAGPLGPVAPPRVIDLGTGSGAIALAVKHARPDADVLATDVSTDALAVAQRNAQRLGLAVAFAHHAWWEGLHAAPFHLVLSNPPYIARDDPHLAALASEPTLALTPGGDGLGALREIIVGASERLAPRGWLLLEHGYDQADAVRALLQVAGWQAIETRNDLGGRARCTGARRR